MVGAVYDKAPILYFFAGVLDEGPEPIPVEWRGRFYLDDDNVPFPVYPHAMKTKAGFVARVIEQGPSGGPGLLATPFSLDLAVHATLMVYDSSNFRSEVEIEDGVWVLIHKDFHPEDVLRDPPLLARDPYQTRFIRFEDQCKGEWYIPCCLPQSSNCMLPMTDMYERGKWRQVPMVEYRHIAAITERLYRAEIGEEDPPDEVWLREATCAAFAVNYEITPAELGAIGILNGVVYLGVSYALTDHAARMAEAQKKTV